MCIVKSKSAALCSSQDVENIALKIRISRQIVLKFALDNWGTFWEGGQNSYERSSSSG